jgi:hypothetical protein
MNFLFIIPSLDDQWKTALKSVMNQSHDGDIHAIVIHDDAGEESLQPIDGRWNTLLWKRKGRNYAAKNIFDALQKSLCFGLSGDTVVAIVDGDDRLDIGAVSMLSTAYKNGAWVTHGSYTQLSTGRKIGRPYPTGCDYRAEKWRGSHLKTMRYDLALRIPEACYKGPDGEWMRVCYDLAMMFPAMEMAGHSMVRFIQKSMYIYNDLNPLNDYKVRGEEQANVDTWIRSLPRFKQI